MKPDLLVVVTGQTVLSSTLFEKKESSYETTCPTFLVLSTSTRNQFKAETNPEMQITDSTTQVNLHLFYSELFEFRASQSYIWRPGEHAKKKVSLRTKQGKEWTDGDQLHRSQQPSCSHFPHMKKAASSWSK
ncbi:hypothetical protein YC2023_116828 [Brassica napus]